MQSLQKEELLSCIKNSVNHHEDEEAYLTFLRFSDRQMQVYEPDPLSRLMSQCSSGVCLCLETNGDEVVIDCKTTELRPKMLVEIKGEMTIGQVIQMLGNTIWKASKAGNKLDLAQHFDLYVNDCYQSAIRLSSGQLSIPLENPGHQWIKLKIWLPLYIPLSIRNVCVNGEWRECDEKRPVLYAFGDSITQGFISGRPSFCYVTQLAEMLGFDALNQGIGGAMFDPHILDDLESLPQPDQVLVAYGSNDWHHGLDFGSVKDKVTLFFDRLHHVYPNLPTHVLTPIWREDMGQPQKCGSFEDISQLIHDTASVFPNIQLIDGLKVSPHNTGCYADGFLHPNTLGFSYLAQRLYKAFIGN